MIKLYNEYLSQYKIIINQLIIILLNDNPSLFSCLGFIQHKRQTIDSLRFLLTILSFLNSIQRQNTQKPKLVFFYQTKKSVKQNPKKSNKRKFKAQPSEIIIYKQILLLTQFFQQNPRNALQLIQMSSDQIGRSNGLQTSLDFSKQFTYINLIQQELSKDRKRSTLKIHSKISAPFPRNKPISGRKIGSQQSQTKSQIRKKTKNNERSLSKKKLSEKKSFSKNYDIAKKSSKALDVRLKETKSKSSKSLKSNPMKKTNIVDPPKRLQNLGRKLRVKEEVSNKIEKPQKSEKKKPKSGGKPKNMRNKSVAQLEAIPLSQIHKQKGWRQSKIFHQYFGIEDKLSSIVEEKDLKHKRNTSKLSKCKTQSSSSSISMKNGMRFLQKPAKMKK